MSNAADLAIESLRAGRDLAPMGYTSDLSVDEAILLDEIGFEPCGFVTGTTVFHIGYGGLFSVSLGNQEMVQITNAMRTARHVAMSQLYDHARRTSADAAGVVGMRLHMRMIPGSSMAEFLAMGTAIRPKGNADLPGNMPFFGSDLSGQDFYLLFKAGYMPCDLVMGSCVYHVQRRSISQWFSQATQNVELENFTNALYDAREIAMTRLEDEVQSLGADGVVGMQVHELTHVWGSHVIEFFAIGTAIRRFSQSNLPKVTPAVPLNDPPQKFA
jgi:uncharacterized protein YbjQ (UPF0145 family)